VTSLAIVGELPNSHRYCSHVRLRWGTQIRWNRSPALWFIIFVRD